ncbi:MULTISPECIES: delta(1)-pyrroline-2-carboxylate reductase family protein [Ramlibacter]|uniref:Delta(1)-pyrroline-2-carboxylate reductase family protein n=1 Tax=Ramlibacter pinisoli TaxID=2682844 RepID=A0A6N8IZI8_9BURK|nr:MULTISPECIES: delta(1)-pyrroline-2-carboxylate reductase family protein [Ramlibacter]MBA2962517.1 delta(1)-pyrroline-2-carboxylate reductase family protein [Ramlibacter sp. CGMCC 1.13660]MVQ32459.1 delta(1)-pyrroline-2-carboxylate reductase family protein [Ramlibacter pinisoli]
MPALLDAAATADRLPFSLLADEIERLLGDATVQVPARLVQPLPGGGSLFVMPALDGRLAITKLITFTPANAGTARPAIQGDVVVFDAATGVRQLVLDGPTVTARRTAAVSLLAARRLAPQPAGPLLVVGAGAQAQAHVEAFTAGLGVRELRIVSRTRASAQALAGRARGLGLRVEVVDDADAALATCPLVVTATPASQVVLNGPCRPDAFIAAVGAFTPRMVELAPALCRALAAQGTVVLDTPDAVHEAGDLLQAGLDPAGFPTLRDIVLGHATRPGPVLFKSCGWAGWDLAAARCALREEP